MRVKSFVLLCFVVFILVVSNNALTAQRCDRYDPLSGFEELPCAWGFDWNICKCKDAPRGLPDSSPEGGGVGGGIGGEMMRRPSGEFSGPAGVPGQRLLSNVGTLVCGCHGSVYLFQLRSNPTCASGYDMILPCPGQCSGGGVPWGARCY